MRISILSLLIVLFCFCSKSNTNQPGPTHIQVDYSDQTGLQFVAGNGLTTNGPNIVWPEGTIKNLTGHDVSNLKISFAIYDSSKYRTTITSYVSNAKNNSSILNDGDVGAFSSQSSYIFVSDSINVSCTVFLDYTGYKK